ncbi:hypothetical protein PgNI_05666 [Pyricularia grisea]|uniref:Uncharacterized protein n=1 Tax=Pyricularia grisea TaxID=148305 RepID=A0A6P8B662_PYRGI|nr:hypothetical protein PgNI_05666 [Pyricularia grisea]TLD10743.1 hypothetical protein PgNI_05666 [Pyricularia grisea]
MISGDPGGDFFVAPEILPSMYTMDRWIGCGLHARTPRNNRQQLDSSTRYIDLGKDLYAHQTWWNELPSPLTSVDDVLDLGYVGPSVTIREVMDTTKGPFCYFYQ